MKHWLFTTDHKQVGLLYFFTSLYFGVVGAILALLMRVQLSVPNNDFLQAAYYNQAVTMHGLIMIFWFLSPLGIALFNYFVPLQIGAKDLAFPRLNALTYWLFLAGGLMAVFSFFVPGGAAAAGWTSYEPLAGPVYSPGPGPTMTYLGLMLMAASVTIGSVNFIATILWLRKAGMKLMQMPMFTWFALFTVVAMLFAFPAIIAAFLLVLSDRLIGTVLYAPPSVLSVPGIDPSLLWDDLFWFFGHPEVYIVLLPAFGVIADLTPAFTGRPLAGKNWILLSTAVIVLPISFGVWMHHMFLTGIPSILQEVFDASTEVISIPFGIIVIMFILSMVRGRVRFKTPFLFVIGALVLFIIGGIMGVFLSSPVLDRVFYGSYFVVSHFHYVMVGATIFGLFAGIYYWLPKMTGKMYSEKLGKLHFILSFVGFNILYAPMMLLSDMPRRIFTYQNIGDWAQLNGIATIGAFIFAGAQIVIAYNLLHTWFRGAPAGPNPWSSEDLEWSSPAAGTTPAVPVGPEPEPAGGWIGQLTSSAPGSPAPATAGSYSTGAVGHEAHLSSRPLTLSAGVMLFLTGAALYPGILPMGLMVLGVAITAYSLVGWAWDDIRDKFTGPPEEVEGDRWPFDAVSKMKLGMWVFLSSEMVLFGTLLGAYIFIREAALQWPAAGSIHDIPLATANTLVLVTSGFTMVMAIYAIRRGDQRGLLAWLSATFLLGSVFIGVKVSEWIGLVSGSTPFVPGSANPVTALAASVYYVVVGLHGAHVVAGLIILVYLMKKTTKGGYTKERHEAIENFALYWAFVEIVWCFVFPLFYLL
ncbi:MAG: cbb3-type cytochrome c oxidase subunit I [Nitrososphaerales archaeon]